MLKLSDDGTMWVLLADACRHHPHPAVPRPLLGGSLLLIVPRIFVSLYREFREPVANPLCSQWSGCNTRSVTGFAGTRLYQLYAQVVVMRIGRSRPLWEPPALAAEAVDVRRRQRASGWRLLMSTSSSMQI